MPVTTPNDPSASDGIAASAREALPEMAPPRLGPPGLAVSLFVITAIYVLGLTPYRVDNPGAVYFTLVVYTAINNGPRQSLLVALLTWCFSVFFTVTGQEPGRWVAEYPTRWVLLALNLVAVSILAGILQQRAEKLRAAQLSAQFTELSLRQSRDWLATTMQSIGDALVATDADGRITYINGAAEALSGWRGVEVTGRPPEQVFRLVHARTGAAVQNPVQEALRQGRVINLSNSVCLVTREGGQIPIDDSAAPIRDSNGKIIGAVAVFRDVSARKASAKALERSETLFRATIEESPIAILLCNADGSILRTNKAWEELYQVTRDQLDDYNIRTDPQIAALGYAPLIERTFQGESMDLPLIHYDPAKIGKPGRARWISTIAYPVKDADNNVTEVVLMIEDVTERQRALEALRQSDQRYQSLVRASAQIIWTTFPDGSVYDMPMWRAFTGQSMDEVRGLGWLGAVHPHERKASMDDWLKAVAARVACKLEYNVRRADGVYRRFEVRGVPVLQPDGALREWVGSCSDVTEARRDAALLAGQKRVLEKVARGAALEDTLHVLAEVVQEQAHSICSIMLVNEDGRTLRSAAGPLLPPEYVAHIQNIPIAPTKGSCGTAAYRGEFVSVADIATDPLWDGAHHIPETFGLHACWSQPIFDPSGDVAGTFAMYGTAPGEPDPEDLVLIQAAADLAEIAIARTTIERGMRSALARETETAARLGAILRHIADGVVVADASGRIAYANDVARALHGVDHLGDTLEEYGRIRPRFDAEGNPLAAEQLPAMPAAPGAEDAVDGEWQIERPGGERVWVQGTAVALPGLTFSADSAAPGENPAPVRGGTVLTLHDITDARRVVAELKHASRMKDEFLAILSHELRTPLTPILGWVSLLRRTRFDQSGMFDQAVDSIERNAELQKRLINDLLDTSRIISGKLRIEPGRADLNAVAALTIRTIESATAERHIHITGRLDPHLAPFDFDYERIQQVLLNILSNAAKFSPNGGTVELATRFETAPDGSRRAHITVEDQGEGIAADILPHIFDVFRQGDSSFTRRHGGMGLGLSIARSIVELHGGHMEAHSPGPTLGATLSFWLPMDNAAG